MDEEELHEFLGDTMYCLLSMECQRAAGHFIEEMMARVWRSPFDEEFTETSPAFVAKAEQEIAAHWERVEVLIKCCIDAVVARKRDGDRVGELPYLDLFDRTPFDILQELRELNSAQDDEQFNQRLFELTLAANGDEWTTPEPTSDSGGC